MRPRILVIVGPTAVGKSDLAVKLAKKFNGEVISADSRQVYKGLNIGTGKITKKEMCGVKHYLLDVANPKRKFTVVKFVELADKVIANILKRGKLPIICGGTGFYIEALVDGVVIPDVAPNLQLRKRLEKSSISECLLKLKHLDPDRYKTIEKHNKRRIIRAIEIASALGKVPKATKSSAKYNPIFIGLTTTSANLRKRIKQRLIARLKKGMLNEAKLLRSEKLSYKRFDELGLEYRYLAKLLRKEISRQLFIEKLNIEIWRYAKRQMTWFKRDNRIKWFTPKDHSLTQYVKESIIKPENH